MLLNETTSSTTRHSFRDPAARAKSCFCEPIAITIHKDLLKVKGCLPAVFATGHDYFIEPLAKPVLAGVIHARVKVEKIGDAWNKCLRCLAR